MLQRILQIEAGLHVQEQLLEVFREQRVVMHAYLFVAGVTQGCNANITGAFFQGLRSEST